MESRTGRDVARCQQGKAPSKDASNRLERAIWRSAGEPRDQQPGLRLELRGKGYALDANADRPHIKPRGQKMIYDPVCFSLGMIVGAAIFGGPLLLVVYFYTR